MVDRDFTSAIYRESWLLAAFLLEPLAVFRVLDSSLQQSAIETREDISRMRAGGAMSGPRCSAVISICRAAVGGAELRVPGAAWARAGAGLRQRY